MTAPEHGGRDYDHLWTEHQRAVEEIKQLRAENKHLRSGLERIGRCCGNSNFVANETLGYGRVAHPDDAKPCSCEGLVYSGPEYGYVFERDEACPRHGVHTDALL